METYVAEHASIEQRSMNIPCHRSYISRARFFLFEILNPHLCRHVPIQRISFVYGVDFTAAGDADVAVGKDELAEGRVESEAVHSEASGEDQHAGRVVQSIACGDKLVTGLQQILSRRLLSRFRILPQATQQAKTQREKRQHARGAQPASDREAKKESGNDFSSISMGASDQKRECECTKYECEGEEREIGGRGRQSARNAAQRVNTE